MRLPRFPGRLWAISDLAEIPTTDATRFAEIHATAQTAWQQQALEVLSTIWQWRHKIEEGAQQWTSMAATYLMSVLRSSLRGLLESLPRVETLRDPRRQLLTALSRGYDDVQHEPANHDPSTPERHILFFDGGSRGNPGPGGAGAVLVSTGPDATSPRIEWSASMSYAQGDMTNNKAEYWGAITGLREARARGWRVEVVGDSNLILGQLAEYRPPKNMNLKPLYSEARRLADLVGVDVWQHHLRAYNKMADAAANAAMDLQASVQTAHPSQRGRTATIDSFLLSDYQEWHTRHIYALCAGLSESSFDDERTVEERNLWAVACKNVVGAKRAAWRIVASIEDKTLAPEDAKRAAYYRETIEQEISTICDQVLEMTDKRLLPQTASDEGRVFLVKTLDDYYRYLAEVQVGEARAATVKKSV